MTSSSNRFIVLYAVATVICASGLALAQSHQPSLGEVARKSRTAAKPRVRVITNDELPKAEPGANGAVELPKPQDPEPATAPAGGSSSAEPAAPPKSAAPAKLTELQQEEVFLKGRISSLEAKVEKEQGSSTGTALQNMISGFKQRLEEVQRQLQAERPVASNASTDARQPQR